MDDHLHVGQHEGFVAPDFAFQIARIEAGQQQPIMEVGNLAAKRDFTDVRDVVRGLVSTLQAPLRAGTTVELGTGRSTSVAEVVTLIYERAHSRGRPLLAALPNRPGEATRQVADAVAAERLIGWKAETTVQEGLDELVGMRE